MAAQYIFSTIRPASVVHVAQRIKVSALPYIFPEKTQNRVFKYTTPESACFLHPFPLRLSVGTHLQEVALLEQMGSNNLINMSAKSLTSRVNIAVMQFKIHIFSIYVCIGTSKLELARCCCIILSMFAFALQPQHRASVYLIRLVWMC